MNVPIFPSPPKKSKISEERILVGEELTALLAKEMAIMELEGNPVNTSATKAGEQKKQTQKGGNAEKKKAAT